MIYFALMRFVPACLESRGAAREVSPRQVCSRHSRRREWRALPGWTEGGSFPGWVFRAGGRSFLRPRRENAPSQPASNAHSSISFDPQFPAFGVMARPGPFDSMAQRAALSFGMKRTEQAGRSNLRGLDGEKAMRKGFSGAHSPANLGRGVLVSCSPRVVGPPWETGIPQGARANFEFPKNSINIDKFPKMFMSRTKGISYSKLTGCRNILK